YIVTVYATGITLFGKSLGRKKQTIIITAVITTPQINVAVAVRVSPSFRKLCASKIHPAIGAPRNVASAIAHAEYNLYGGWPISMPFSPAVYFVSQDFTPFSIPAFL